MKPAPRLSRREALAVRYARETLTGAHMAPEFHTELLGQLIRLFLGVLEDVK